MKGYNIEVKNNLLEPKHIHNMGAAVWLYMWLLDKITSVNENGIGKVLGSTPITHATVEADLGIDRRTYQRWVNKLRDAGYIKTVRAKYGLVITVNKATKTFSRRSDKSGTSKASRSVKNVVLDETKMSFESDKSGTSLYKEDNTTDIDNSSIDNTEIEISDKAKIGILYYQAIKVLGVPTLNNNTIKAKIKALENEGKLEEVLWYLKFLQTDYQRWTPEFKPEINNALDIYAKRAAIMNKLRQQAQQIKPKGRGWRPKAK